MLSNKFTITYTGVIYRGKQHIEKFCQALCAIVGLGKVNYDEIRVGFYGLSMPWLEDVISKYQLGGMACYHGLVSREESIQRQRESQVLLLLNWEDKSQKGVYPSKVFEYLAAHRPILATGGFKGDYIEKIINETHSGVFAPDVDDIEKALLNFYLDYKKTKKFLILVMLTKLINIVIEKWQENFQKY